MLALQCCKLIMMGITITKCHTTQMNLSAQSVRPAKQKKPFSLDFSEIFRIFGVFLGFQEKIPGFLPNGTESYGKQGIWSRAIFVFFIGKFSRLALRGAGVRGNAAWSKSGDAPNMLFSKKPS